MNPETPGYCLCRNWDKTGYCRCDPKRLEHTQDELDHFEKMKILAEEDKRLYGLGPK